MTVVQVGPPDQLVHRPDGGVAARAVRVRKVYGTGDAVVVALDDVTVEFGRGQLTAIMGPSGSGKSTLMHCMAALDTATSGQVIIDGIDLHGLKDKALTMLRREQRVACARALVSRPAIVFADEPTGNLDSRASGEILAFLRRSVDEFGQSIVMVTHDPVAASYADRVIFLVDGPDRRRGPGPDDVVGAGTDEELRARGPERLRCCMSRSEA